MLTCITFISFAATAFAAPLENKNQADRKAEMLKKFDKDGDGKLSDAEKATLRAEIQSLQGGKDRGLPFQLLKVSILSFVFVF